MGLHLPESWHITEVVTGPARRNPGLHWYVAFAPKEKSWPTILPLTGGSGIPQDITGCEGRQEMFKVKALLAKSIFNNHLYTQSVSPSGIPVETNSHRQDWCAVNNSLAYHLCNHKQSSLERAHAVHVEITSGADLTKHWVAALLLSVFASADTVNESGWKQDSYWWNIKGI